MVLLYKINRRGEKHPELAVIEIPGVLSISCLSQFTICPMVTNQLPRF